MLFLDRNGLMAVDGTAGLAERNARNTAMKGLPWQAIAIMLQWHDVTSNKSHVILLPSPLQTHCRSQAAKVHLLSQP